MRIEKKKKNSGSRTKQRKQRVSSKFLSWIKTSIYINSSSDIALFMSFFKIDNQEEYESVRYRSELFVRAIKKSQVGRIFFEFRVDRSGRVEERWRGRIKGQWNNNQVLFGDEIRFRNQVLCAIGCFNYSDSVRLNHHVKISSDFGLGHLSSDPGFGHLSSDFGLGHFRISSDSGLGHLKGNSGFGLGHPRINSDFDQLGPGVDSASGEDFRPGFEKGSGNF